MKPIHTLLLLGLVLSFRTRLASSRQIYQNAEDVNYGEDEEDEEDDQDMVTTTTTTTTTTTPAPAPQIPESPAVEVLRQGTPNNGTGSNPAAPPLPPQRPASLAATSTTPEPPERVYQVLGQVGNILSNIAYLNVSGIVDHALGIRNSEVARPLVNNLLYDVFCFRGCNGPSGNQRVRPPRPGLINIGRNATRSSE